MTFQGQVKNGVVVLNDSVKLPEGASVEIVLAPELEKEVDLSQVPTLSESLKDVIGSVDDLPSDYATNLDHYLYGAGKTSL